MNSQPIEIIICIIKYVSPIDQICNLSLVCKKWNNIIKSETITGRCNNFSEFILNDMIHFYPKYLSKYILDSQCYIYFGKYILNKNMYYHLCSTVPNNKYLKNFFNNKFKTYTCQEINLNDMLIWSVDNNHYQLVKFLHENGANLNVYGSHTILIAARSGFTDILKYYESNGQTLDDHTKKIYDNVYGYVNLS